MSVRRIGANDAVCNRAFSHQPGSTMKHLKRVAFLAAAILLAGRAYALTDTIDLPDIGTFSGAEDFNLTDTFSGNGFVGIYPPPQLGAGFAHVFGVEYYGYTHSEVELQADISALAGDAITSAYLDFTFTGGSGLESVNLNGFTDSTGTLAFDATPPGSNYVGSVIAAGISEGANSIDVTSIAQSAVSSGQDYLGLFLAPLGGGFESGQSGLYTDTYTGDGDNADSADVSLVINYTPGNATVPDGGSTLALVAIGAACVAAFGQRRKLAP
jgi:hypothetical protein